MIRKFVLILILTTCLFPTMTMARNDELVPGFEITLGELEFPQKVKMSEIVEEPSLEAIKGKQVTLIRVQYRAKDKSRANVHLQLIVPSLAAQDGSVFKYYDEIKKLRMAQAEEKKHTKIYAKDFETGFDVEYTFKYRDNHYRHIGALDKQYAFFIDAVSTLGNPVDATVEALEKAAKKALLIIMLAQKTGPPKGLKIPGHNLTVPGLFFPKNIGDMKIHGAPRLNHHKRRFATRLSYLYWDWQAQASVSVALYIPAPGSQDTDTAVNLFWTDYQYELDYAPTRGFKILVNNKFNNRFTLEKERKGKYEHHYITGVRKDRYCYIITLIERGGPIVDYGVAGLRRHSDAAIRLLKQKAEPQLSSLKKGQYEPGIQECYNSKFPKLPRANLHVDNQSRFNILLQTEGSSLVSGGSQIARRPAKVVIDSHTARMIYHALPAGRAMVSADPEEWQGKTKIVKWTIQVLNKELKTCKKIYTLTITDADFGIGTGPKGGWQEQTSPAVEDSIISIRPNSSPGVTKDEWEAIVE